jgi:hypothetical protein
MRLSAWEDLTEFCHRESSKSAITSLQCVSPGATPGTLVLNAGWTCLLPYESGLTIVCRGPCSLFPLPWLPWLSSCSEWVSECVDVFVSQICRPKGGRCCTKQVASEMRSNWNAVASELRSSKCHGACSIQNLLTLHLPHSPTAHPKSKT